jgi:hypothetical protein
MCTVSWHMPERVDNQAQVREYVAKIIEKHITQPKSVTVQHFRDEGKSRKIMTTCKMRYLALMFEDKDGVSLRGAARTSGSRYSDKPSIGEYRH